MPLLRSLAIATHPLPTVAVTSFTAVMARSAGMRGRRTALLSAAVLSGQLVIGWSNDYLDRDRDARAGRTDKPIPRGDIAARTVGGAAVVAGFACIPLSLALGRRPAAAHLTVVGCGLTYNAWAKFTLLSPLPYACAFSLLPPWVVALSLPGSPPPRRAIWLATGLLGVSAHFANTPDDEVFDGATGVRGLPQRLGPRRSILVSALLLCAASPLLLPSTATAWRSARLVAGLLCAGGATTAALSARTVLRGERTRTAFQRNLLASGLLLGASVVGGDALTD
ncbi:MAG: UbiA family prenyltransferase [Actinomycetota bacterium]|nr:UbiA family prenyltransferase [Actinomycetota bacterium]